MVVKSKYNNPTYHLEVRNFNPITENILLYELYVCISFLLLLFKITSNVMA